MGEDKQLYCLFLRKRQKALKIPRNGRFRLPLENKIFFKNPALTFLYRCALTSCKNVEKTNEPSLRCPKADWRTNGEEQLLYNLSRYVQVVPLKFSRQGMRRNNRFTRSDNDLARWATLEREHWLDLNLMQLIIWPHVLSIVSFYINSIKFSY